MLVITRKPGERICLGDDVTVTVLEVRGDQVRLGIDAPRDVKVFREEVLHRDEPNPPPGSSSDPSEAGST